MRGLRGISTRPVDSQVFINKAHAQPPKSASVESLPHCLSAPCLESSSIYLLFTSDVYMTLSCLVGLICTPDSICHSCSPASPAWRSVAPADDTLNWFCAVHSPALPNACYPGVRSSTCSGRPHLPLLSLSHSCAQSPFLGQAQLRSFRSSFLG